MFIDTDSGGAVLSDDATVDDLIKVGIVREDAETIMDFIAQAKVRDKSAQAALEGRV